MFTLKRKSLSMPSLAEALRGCADALPTAVTHFVNGAPLNIHKARRPPYSGLVASGVLKNASGAFPVSSSLRSVTLAGSRPIRPMRKCARAALGITSGASGI
jgi:hypothetical protein